MSKAPEVPVRPRLAANDSGPEQMPGRGFIRPFVRTFIFTQRICVRPFERRRRIVARQHADCAGTIKIEGMDQ